jgi:hypothetical protein
MTEEQYQAAKTIRNKIAAAKARVHNWSNKLEFFRKYHKYKDDLNQHLKADEYEAKLKEAIVELNKLKQQFIDL